MFLVLDMTSTKLPSNLKKKVDWVISNIEWKMGENEKSVHSLQKVCMINMHCYAGNYAFVYW